MKLKMIMLNLGIFGIIAGALAGNFLCDITNGFIGKMFHYLSKNYFLGIVFLVVFIMIMVVILIAPKNKHEYVFVHNPFKGKSVAGNKYNILKFISHMEKQGHIIIEMPMNEEVWLFKKKAGTPDASIEFTRSVKDEIK